MRRSKKRKLFRDVFVVYETRLDGKVSTTAPLKSVDVMATSFAFPSVSEAGAFLEQQRDAHKVSVEMPDLCIDAVYESKTTRYHIFHAIMDVPAPSEEEQAVDAALEAYNTELAYIRELENRVCRTDTANYVRAELLTKGKIKAHDCGVSLANALNALKDKENKRA